MNRNDFVPNTKARNAIFMIRVSNTNAKRLTVFFLDYTKSFDSGWHEQLFELSEKLDLHREIPE